MAESNNTESASKSVEPAPAAPVAPVAAPAPVASAPTPQPVSQSRVAELEAALQKQTEILAKVQNLFGVDKADPAQELALLRQSAEQATQAAERAIVSAAVVREAARAGFVDPEDAADYVAKHHKICVDVPGCAVKDPQAILAAINALKTSKPHWIARAPDAPTPAPIAVRPPAPVAGVQSAPASKASVWEMWRGASPSAARSSVQGKSK